jgi:large conductance mechanosensitive channel
MDLNPIHLTPAKHAISLWDEFKKFAFKGNLIDMAIALAIGAAFGKLVDSFVKNVMMPLVSIILPGEGYATWKTTIQGVEVPYGLFVGEFVNFVVMSLAIFIFMVKLIGFLVRRRETPATPPAPTRSEELLTEIRDLLKKPA